MGLESEQKRGNEEFKALLRENGLKVTSQRVAILEVLQERPGQHLTVEEIYDLVRKQYPETGLATVYRTVQLLSELNLIDRLSLDGGYARYEIGKAREGSGHRHHHLICLNCGALTSFEGDLLETLESNIEDSCGFQVVNHDVKLFWYCKNCRNKS